MNKFSKHLLSLSSIAFVCFSSQAEAQKRTNNALTEKKKASVFESTQAPSRMLYLNGINIGNVRNQELQNVTIRIDDAGNISIVAPQYDVSQESSYHPLLPAELPKYPKSHAQIPGIPEGRYSKDSSAPPAGSPRNELREDSSAQSIPASITATKNNGREDSSAPPLNVIAPATPVVSPTQTVPPPASPDIPSDSQGKAM